MSQYYFAAQSLQIRGKIFRAPVCLQFRIGRMSAPYEQLLDAAIEHLRDLKARGTRFVVVAPETVAALRPAIANPAAPARPDSNSRPRASSGPAPAAAPIASAPRPTLPASSSGRVASSPMTPSVPALTAATLDTPAKAKAIEELRERAMVCVKCSNLAASRRNVVFGIGDINAAIMFVGEAPGADEDAQGEPFVGAAGQLLTRIIQTMGQSRETVYIANILKCRPDTPGESSGNRKPSPDEMKTCIPYLHSQIDLIQPKVLVALGGTAVEGLLGKTEGITRLRGKWQTYRGIPLMPTFHPSYLLRNQALSEKRRVWEDMLQVMEKVGLPISEKQRGYFLKG
jgi:uracil-DNA glycosylase